MQVTHGAEFRDSVTLGGGESMQFTMASTPEFFTVLSDTLYTNKVGAVVRENICNAWDAHKKVGITDRPIEIHVSNDTFSIRDFGPGLSEAGMAIFRTFGASDKTHDASQTGGFGLGCKSGFCYTDQFTVVSRHAGVQTIYAVSRGGVESRGLPEMRKMASCPTEETGITIEFPLKSDDAAKFLQEIKHFLYPSGINAKLNDKPVETIGRVDLGAFLIHEFNRGGEFGIRYGNVVYPLYLDSVKDILRDAGKSDLYSVVSDLAVAKRNGGYMILDARPDTISVTPSREALSLNPKTIETVAGLFERLVRIIKKQRVGFAAMERFFYERSVSHRLKDWRYFSVSSIGLGRDLFKSGITDQGTFFAITTVLTMNTQKERKDKSRAVIAAYLRGWLSMPGEKDVERAKIVLEALRRLRKSKCRDVDYLSLDNIVGDVAIGKKAKEVAKFLIDAGCMDRARYSLGSVNFSRINSVWGMMSDARLHSDNRIDPVNFSILVAPNQTSAGIKIGKDLHGAKPSLVISTAQMREGDLKRLEEALKRTKLEVKRVERAVKVKPNLDRSSEEVLLRGRDLVDTGLGLGICSLRSLRKAVYLDAINKKPGSRSTIEQLVEDPKIYVDATDWLGAKALNKQRAVKQISVHLPDIAICLTKNDLERAKKAKAVDLFDYIKGEVEKRKNSRRFLAALCDEGSYCGNFPGLSDLRSILKATKNTRLVPSESDCFVASIVTWMRDNIANNNLMPEWLPKLLRSENFAAVKREIEEIVAEVSKEISKHSFFKSIYFSHRKSDEAASLSVYLYVNREKISKEIAKGVAK